MRTSALGRTFLLSACCLFGCSAVYPELTTPLRTPPADFRLVPPAPPDVFYFRFAGADIPTRTRDGRKWDGGEAPDPFAKLILNGKDLIVTSVESDTLRPTWPDQDRANYRFRASDVLKVEVWDSNPLTNHPICTEKLPSLHEFIQGDEPYLEVECDNGGRVRLIVQAAHARLGLGFWYELRTGQAVVTRVIGESPAGRAGLHAGDEIVAAQGQPVASMEDGKLQSLVNANSSVGLKLSLKSESGVREVTVKDGAIYPVQGEGVPLE